MPRLQDAFLDAVVYVLQARVAPDGEVLDEPEPGSGGTGFIVSVPFENRPDHRCAYVVTNAHVVPLDEPTWLRFNLAGGGTDMIRVPPGDWFIHNRGDDVAVTPFMFDGVEQVRGFAIPLTWLLRESHPFAAGDEAFFVGRHLSLDHHTEVTPAVRFGNVSIIKPQPIWQGSDRPRHQQSIVVEARTFGGYSGSPVYVSMGDWIGAPQFRRFKKVNFPQEPLAYEDEPVFKDWDIVVHKGETEGPLAVLGICWGHMKPDGASLPGTRGMTRHEREMFINSGMMLVIPGWKITELLMQENVKRTQDEIGAELNRRDEQGAVMDSAGRRGTPDDERVSLADVDREDALRALLRTPPRGGEG